MGELSCAVTDMNDVDKPVDKSRVSSNEDNKASSPACSTESEIGEHEDTTSNKHIVAEGQHE